MADRDVNTAISGSVKQEILLSLYQSRYMKKTKYSFL